jgi:hypothetical protein
MHLLGSTVPNTSNQLSLYRQLFYFKGNLVTHGGAQTVLRKSQTGSPFLCRVQYYTRESNQWVGGCTQYKDIFAILIHTHYLAGGGVEGGRVAHRGVYFSVGATDVRLCTNSSRTYYT